MVQFHLYGLVPSIYQRFIEDQSPDRGRLPGVHLSQEAQTQQPNGFQQVVRNRGRVGVIKSREKHKGSFETIHVQDATGHEFATRMGNIFTIGKGSKPWVSLPKGKGIKLSIIEEAKKRHAAQVGAAA
ncbi:hypothetical protein RHGRI_026538 [Rhododendron griersonianum]|uniref:Small ribosomal subunit protein eS4 C-terminal domain-containing protein n=1 Tax=Rhododendron griersonianum TaxID=479676 RepID=A0AAV6IYL7_9ERIC|nr:hypothetical protein RHGRI_026538 [Rhododendron griersonianum]